MQKIQNQSLGRIDSSTKFLFAVLSFVVAAIFALLPLGANAAAIIRAPNNLGLVGYWSFDEGKGTQVSDLSGNGNDGVLVNDPGWVTGRFGGGVQFDGVNNQNVRVSNNSDFNIGSDGFTYSAWIRPTSFTQPYNMFMGHQLPYFNVRSSQLLHMSMTAEGSQRSVLGSTKLEAGQWYHAVATYDGDGYMRVYLNGEEDGIAGPFPVASNHDSHLYIGGWNSGSTYQFTGEVDEVRVYSRALSASEVQSLHNSSKSTVLGVTTDRYNDGLVAHYTFDGSTISGNTVKDVAGNNDGVISGGAKPEMGIIGQSMDMSQGNVSVTDTPELNIKDNLTIALWLKPEAVLNGYASHPIRKQNNTTDANFVLYFFGFYPQNQSAQENMLLFYANAGGTWRTISKSHIAVIGEWVHVALVYNSSSGGQLYIDGKPVGSPVGSGALTVNSAPLRIGDFPGKIDDVRIYNRALPAEEIFNLYSAVKPSVVNSSSVQPSIDEGALAYGLVGHWPFDENSGTVASDASGNGNHGVVSGGARWVTGKIGNALLFDGIDDRVLYGNPESMRFNGSSSFTISAWINPKEYRAVNSIFDKFRAQGYRFHLSSTGYLEAQFRDGTAGVLHTSSSRWDSGLPIIPFDTWTFVAMIVDKGDVTFCVGITCSFANTVSFNFISETTEAWSGWAPNNSNSFYSGLLDELRVYNRALSPLEIQTLYSMGQ